MKIGKINFIAAIGLLLLLLSITNAQTTAFNYQGKLTDGGNPANGAFQMQFKLFDALSGGNQIGATLADVAVTAANGVFSAKLDFGASALSGANRWLEIAVRRNSGESYTTLAPREQINSSPYAVRTLSAQTADVATNALNLGGFAPNLFVQTSDPRLSDARSPLPNSPNYIQNMNTQQALSNFNISGNGTIGGSLAVTQGISAAGLNIAGSSDFNQTINLFNGNLFVNTGRIGIGTNSPQSRLQINGSGGFSTANPARFDIRNSAAGAGFFQYVTDAGNLDFHNLQNTFLMRMDQSGRLYLGEFQFTRLSLGVGDPWTTDNWAGEISMPNASAFGWNFNASGQRFGIGQTTGGLYFFRTFSGFGSTASPATYDLTLTNSGFLGIGMGSLSNAPQRLLHVNGRARIGAIPLEASTAQVCFNQAGDLLQCGASSLKWKTNVRPFNSGLDVVLRLQPMNFNWKESGKTDFGLGAEDVAKVAPELAFFNPNGEVEGVKYDRLSVVFVNAFKEQQRQIERQSDIIERQQRQIDVLIKLNCRQNPNAKICREGK